MSPLLPIEATATEALLLAETAPNFEQWLVRARMPFASAPRYES